ncbi:Mod r domain containing protein, partial [Asbolus verrucosus]
MSFLLYLLTIISSISLCIVAFLIVSAGNFAKFKNTHQSRPRQTILPIISRYGDLISCPQDLDFHLAGLKTRLKEKYQELETFKAKIYSRMENLHKFDNYKKGCLEMQANLVKIEEECDDLQQKIEYFKQ